MKQYTFIIPGQLPGLNEIIEADRSNKYSGAKMKKKNTEDIVWIIKANKIPKHDRIGLRIAFYELSKRRDKDNIMAGQKFILDGLVMAGIIKNDGWVEINELIYEFHVDKSNPRVEVTLWESTEEEYLHHERAGIKGE
ncbi:MAG: Holliday junction resolvase [Fastidiosipilaceae bacterium]|jgi:hypothetical protein